MSPNIANLDAYNVSMRKSLIDKVFFVDKLPDRFSLVDFGCADGTLVGFLAALFPDNKYVGYDRDPAMISKARSMNPALTFSTDLENMVKQTQGSEASAILLSSVLHEVYSYGSSDEIDAVWSSVFSSNLDYIIIRDMIPSRSVDRLSYEEHVKSVIHRLASGTLPTTLRHLDEFQAQWGSITNFKNLTHFLLKYRYVENWKREVRENYLPLTLEDLYALIPPNYEILYKEHYSLPFNTMKIRSDFGFEFREPTHLKLILRRVR